MHSRGKLVSLATVLTGCLGADSGEGAGAGQAPPWEEDLSGVWINTRSFRDLPTRLDLTRCTFAVVFERDPSDGNRGATGSIHGTFEPIGGDRPVLRLRESERQEDRRLLTRLGGLPYASRRDPLPQLPPSLDLFRLERDATGRVVAFSVQDPEFQGPWRRQSFDEPTDPRDGGPTRREISAASCLEAEHQAACYEADHAWPHRSCSSAAMLGEYAGDTVIFPGDSPLIRYGAGEAYFQIHVGEEQDSFVGSAHSYPLGLQVTLQSDTPEMYALEASVLIAKALGAAPEVDPCSIPFVQGKPLHRLDGQELKWEWDDLYGADDRIVTIRVRDVEGAGASTCAAWNLRIEPGT